MLATGPVHVIHRNDPPATNIQACSGEPGREVEPPAGVTVWSCPICFPYPVHRRVMARTLTTVELLNELSRRIGEGSTPEQKSHGSHLAQGVMVHPAGEDVEGYFTGPNCDMTLCRHRTAVGAMDCER